MISVDNIIEQQLPSLHNNTLFARPIKAILRKLLHEREFQAFEQAYPHLKGLDFIEQVLDYFDFTYSVSSKEKERIPSSGRVVIIANHPIGSLDGLALLKLISEIRPDVKAVANDMLMAISPLRSMLLPVNNMQGNTPKDNLKNINKHLANEGAVIIFPAGEVSRLRPNGIKDTAWNSGFYRIAKAAKAPILPIFVDGKNSAIFYSASMLYKPLATALLVREMFKQQKKNVAVRIGEAIEFDSYSDQQFPRKTIIRLFKKHLYRLATNKSGLFKTQTAIAQPEQRQVLKAALEACQLLGQTQDGKKIYLYQHSESSPIMREIGRLREIAFRAVGEGSGLKRDIDKYDAYYYHLILWDQQDLEIVGAYRFADAQKVMAEQGKSALYTHSLFSYQPEMDNYLAQGLELGRSFIQPKYWGKRSLDYLWFGIGAFLHKNPQCRYLFGPVSMSNSFPQTAKDLMVYFYNLYFGYPEKIAESPEPYQYQQLALTDLKQTFVGEDYQADFTQLKHLLANIGVSVPTLYKQYSELCHQGGVNFLAFGVDPDFNHCVDGLVLVDTHQLKDKKRQRYIDSHGASETE
ncbi:lysophospholipid acyltransferase family protein [Endozoicomonas sp. G2_1]|uniref:GNAT family N-acyltransferase n=1 Tax=Endozoicomonas sp. G2_1 TaxID=2821091 RepID=UPI001AD9649F|nr:lysophospholipid acyltransferase family protein [Endozoicomonas sp. G2_1]MBO9489720.1 lysophospholipid acyltransferase family protein [Endozoicomonas sp. G2_1]